MATHPTPYADINALLQRVLSAVQAILGTRFVGMYLNGSLAIVDFEPDKSDIDFVVVTDGDLPGEVFLALGELHARIVAEEPRWGPELEGSYVPLRALGGHDPRPGEHPYIDRGTGTLVMVRQESGYWIIHRQMLRERTA